MTSSMDTPAEQLTADSLFDVKGLKVLVTGGGSGIGLMIARTLACNGSTVYITGRREDVLKVSAAEHGTSVGGKIIPLQGDVTDKDSIAAVRKEVEAKEGHIDLLVNNAGVAGPGFDSSAKDAETIASSLWSADYSEAESLLRINILGYFYTSAAFIPLLSKSPNAPQIVNISSNAAFGRQSMAGVLYSTTKAAVTHLTKMLATHLVHTNIRVNAINPGLFPSELTAGPSNDKNESTLKDTLGMEIPAGRAGYESEMATAILFFATKRQRFASGSTLLVDGGVLNIMPSSY